jgi:DNA-binding CsgD family transcriptional regulator
MLHSQRLPSSLSARPREFLLSVLEETEVGLVVVNAEGAALYLNGSARSIFGAEASALPPWTAEHVRQIVALVHEVDGQVVERWPSSDVTLRVRARPHSPGSQLVVLEVTIAQAGSRQVAESLARSLRLSITDARLLTLLWRGMSNEEIAQTLEVRIGTVKSRLFRLYQRLGVKRRPAAVLRAAEVLGTPVS